MRTAILTALAALAATALVATALAATRTPISYHEDFTTWQFRDGLQTTAAWDTLAASLHLAPPFSVLTGTWNSPGNAVGVEVDGDFAFLADQAAGVQIVDVRQADDPVLLGTYNTTGAAWDVDAEGDWVFVADGGAGLVAVNIANPSAPTAGGTYDSPGTAYAVEVVGDLAYLADGAGGLRVVFVKYPLSPYTVGSTVTGGSAYDVDVDGDIAWVAAYDAGLVAVNITNPVAPVVVGTLNTAGTAAAVAIDGDWAYVADGTNGLLFVDIANPASPVLRSTLALADRARDVAVDGDWVYVADILGGLQVVDVHDPLHPSVVNAQIPPASARAVVLSGDHAYVADYADGLRILRIATSVVPMEPAAPVATVYTGNDQEVAGDYLYQTNAYQGISVYDIRDPLAPALVGSCDAGYAAGLDLAGDRLYVADDEYGLKVVNVSDPAHPVQVGSYDGLSSFYDVTVAGDYLLVANQSAGLTILDITNPAAPAYVASIPTLDWAWEIAVAGNTAYIADYRAGVTVVDIADPAHPAILANLDLPGNVSGLVVAGDYVYATGGADGLVVIDVHDPTAPAVVATFPTTWSSRKIAIHGDRVYLTVGNEGIWVLDIADPLAPTLVDTWDPESYTYAVTVAGDVAFVAASTPGILQPVLVRARNIGDPGVLAHSLTVNVHAEDIVKYRLTTEQSGAIAWELQALDNAPRQLAIVDGSWHDLDAPGNQLRWQATLDIASDPVCTAVDLGWLSVAPVVSAVTDIPADQGGRVRVRFARSAYDFADEPTPITGYNLWRRVDDAALREAVAEAPVVTSDGAVFGDLTLREHAGHHFAADNRAMPAGLWESVGYVSTLQQDAYLIPAATLADSSQTVPWAVFCVTAHTATPTLWYASPPDSGYSVDNIAPAIPAHLALAAGTLTWDPALEPDFAYSTVYGSSLPYLDETAVRLGYTIVPSFDVAGQPHLNYLVTASDVAGNEGPAAAVSATTVVGDALPARTALARAVPNPFNPATVIRYELAHAGVATLRIYDTAGRLVRTLVDAAARPAGRHEARWDGRTDSGAVAAAGVYCCRLTTGDYAGTVRLTLVK